MLREGWDVQGVTVIVGLRPYTSKANILPEQTVGRGLRLMFRGTGSGYIEHVDVIGNNTFIEFVEQLEREEELQLETFEVGKEKVVIVTIAPDEKKKDKDIPIPVLSPVLTRKKSLAEEIAEMDVNKFKCPVLPRKQDDAAAKKFRYEGYDIITLQKMVEREYTIPQPQTTVRALSKSFLDTSPESRSNKGDRGSQGDSGQACCPTVQRRRKQADRFQRSPPDGRTGHRENSN